MVIADLLVPSAKVMESLMFHRRRDDGDPSDPGILYKHLARDYDDGDGGSTGHY